jgi:hypothetical protein
MWFVNMVRHNSPRGPYTVTEFYIKQTAVAVHMAGLHYAGVYSSIPRLEADNSVWRFYGFLQVLNASKGKPVFVHVKKAYGK